MDELNVEEEEQEDARAAKAKADTSRGCSGAGGSCGGRERGVVRL